MNLYLVRHAEAADKEIDPERRLTQRGKLDADRLAQIIGALGLHVEAIWHSPKPRALQTAQALAAAGASEGLSARDGLLPFDRVKPIARLMKRADADLMVVGHEPFLGRLAARLVTGRAFCALVELDKPSALCLTRDGCGIWRIAWLLSPALVPHPTMDTPAATSENP